MAGKRRRPLARAAGKKKIGSDGEEDDWAHTVAPREEEDIVSRPAKTGSDEDSEGVQDAMEQDDSDFEPSGEEEEDDEGESDVEPSPQVVLLKK